MCGCSHTRDGQYVRIIMMPSILEVSRSHPVDVPKYSSTKLLIHFLKFLDKKQPILCEGM